MTIPPPWAHQAQTKQFFSTRPRGNDFSDPGTGKTRGQIETYTGRKSPGRMLVVCPKTLMFSAWACDFEKFAPGATIALAYADNREAAFKLGTDVVITNTDAVKWLADKKNRSLLKDFDHVVVDESTSFKHPTSQRSKALLALRSAFKHRYAMTGTPNPISVTELWNPMMFIDDGKRLGPSFYRFRNVMQVPTQVGPSSNHIRWDDKPGAAQAVDELLADITIRHAFEDVMSHVPKNTPPERKEFELSRRAAAAYTKMEAECVLAFKESTVTAVHAASLRTKLLQIASGAVYSSDDQYEVIDRGRYELIAELVDERKHSLVFFNWRHQRDELSKEFAKAGFDFAVIDGTVSDRTRDLIVRDFQAGRYKTLLLHPRTGAHGLTLTRATTTIISSPIYEADLLKQAIHRTYRGGQTERTSTILIQARGTVESQVYDRLAEKESRMTDLLTLIQNRRAA